MAQNAFFVKKCHFSTCTISRRVASDRFSFNILGRGRPELKALLPMVGFCDMFFIQNNSLEILRYGRTGGTTLATVTPKQIDTSLENCSNRECELNLTKNHLP